MGVRVSNWHAPRWAPPLFVLVTRHSTSNSYLASHIMLRLPNPEVPGSSPPIGKLFFLFFYEILMTG